MFGLDVIHGYRMHFPVPLVQAASWDLTLIDRSARVAATEAAAEGIRWTFEPMRTLHTTRTRRVVEGAGKNRS